MDPDPVLPYALPADRADLAESLTARDAAAIVSRLIAVWLLVQTAQGAVSTVAYFILWAVDRSGRPGEWQFGLISLLSVLGPSAAGWALWSGSHWIARRAVPNDVPIGPLDAPGLQPLMTVGLVMAGAWTMAPALRDLVGAAVYAGQSHGTFAMSWHDPSWLRAVVSDTVGLAFSA